MRTRTNGVHTLAEGGGEGSGSLGPMLDPLLIFYGVAKNRVYRCGLHRLGVLTLN